MRTFTLDSSCIEAIDEGRADVQFIRTLAEAHTASKAKVAVVALSAAEKHQFGSYFDDFDAFREAYVAFLLTQDDAMHRLIERAMRERCCLMCYEADAHDCHRLFVAERAVELSGGALSVVHLDVMID